MPRDDLVLAISGRTRAGKTTLATALEERLGWPAASFSRWIRAEAHRRGIPEERRTLQDLGADLIVELGWRDFCLGMLRHANLGRGDAPFVVEGVRHLGTLAALRDVVAPAPLRLVHLSVSDAERDRRLAAEGVDAATGAAWELHSTEQEVIAGLPEVADLVVDADRPREEVLRTVLDWLEEPDTA
jgi:hypothetical protein